MDSLQKLPLSAEEGQSRARSLHRLSLHLACSSDEKPSSQAETTTFFQSSEANVSPNKVQESYK